MKTLLLALALALLLPLAACAPPQRDDVAADDYTLELSEGSCAVDADCQWAGEACGGGHGMCTNDPAKYENAVTTCDVNANFPANRGFTCGCVEQSKQCGWEK